MNLDSFPTDLRAAVHAAQNKLSFGVTVLDLRELRTFTGYFLICSAASSAQANAIAEEIEARLEALGTRVMHREGARAGQWVLLDYGGFIAHIFHEQARQFFDLERLWRHARRFEVPDDHPRHAGELNATTDKRR